MPSTKSKSSSNGKESQLVGNETSQGFRDLFEDQLRDMYWAEKALTKAIPKMIKNSTTPELGSTLQDHLGVTEKQVKRLEKVFRLLGKTARGKRCPAMAGLIEEGEEIMENTPEGVVRDAGIIGAAQKVEHYEIAAYGTLSAFAKALNEDEIKDLLGETLEEEKEADEMLTDIAESTVNPE